jgi:hypothetical protein
MNIDELYEKVLPYLSNPKAIRDFLDTYKESSNEDLIKEINRQLSETEALLKTDLRILLNALSKGH